MTVYSVHRVSCPLPQLAKSTSSEDSLKATFWGRRCQTCEALDEGVLLKPGMTAAAQSVKGRDLTPDFSVQLNVVGKYFRKDPTPRYLALARRRRAASYPAITVPPAKEG